MSPLHLSDLQMARVIDSPSDCPEELAHLQACRECFGVYSQNIQLRVAPQASEDSGDFSALGRSLHPQSHGTRSNRVRWVVLALAAGLATLLIWPRQFDLGRELVDPVEAALSMESRTGLVFPRVEGAALVAPVTRNGGSSVPGFDPAVQQLFELRRNEPDSYEVAFWLSAALIASEELESARAILAQVVQQFGSSPELKDLHSILETRAGNLDGAIQLARETRQEQDTPRRTLNLALLLKASGESKEAQRLLRSLVEASPESPVGVRAATEM